MIDAIEILLQDKPHINARKLLSFHRANRDLLPRMVAEFRLLKRQGRKKGGAKAVIHFLRWDRQWLGIDEFKINDHLSSLAIRICTLLWPDLDGMTQFNRCGADDILGTRIRRGNLLCPTARTLNGHGVFLPVRRDGAGRVRPIKMGSVTTPPAVPVLDRPATFHQQICESEAMSIAAPLYEIVARSPNPKDPHLCEWLAHFETQPEIFAFIEGTLLERQPENFSANSLLEYARWSIRRAAETDKRFTLPNVLGAFYSRALIIQNPQFNGLCEFREGEKNGLSNRILGYTLAPTRINDEPYRRLLRKDASK